MATLFEARAYYFTQLVKAFAALPVDYEQLFSARLVRLISIVNAEIEQAIIAIAIMDGPAWGTLTAVELHPYNQAIVQQYGRIFPVCIGITNLVIMHAPEYVNCDFYKMICSVVATIYAIN
jgi:hypothetical protein